jgi:hypothetical protein
MTEDRRGRFPEERGDWGREVLMPGWVDRMYAWTDAGDNVMLDEADPGLPGSDDRPIPVLYMLSSSSASKLSARL